eukprot:scaffold96075_cov31-Tisochrysis_lutea.AAC.7
MNADGTSSGRAGEVIPCTRTSPRCALVVLSLRLGAGSHVHRVRTRNVRQLRQPDCAQRCVESRTCRGRQRAALARKFTPHRVRHRGSIAAVRMLRTAQQPASCEVQVAQASVVQWHTIAKRLGVRIQNGP